MTDQVPLTNITAATIMKHSNFRRGFEDARAGHQPRFDDFYDHFWAYERGRQFGYVAPTSMQLFIDGRLNRKALALFEVAYARKVVR